MKTEKANIAESRENEATQSMSNRQLPKPGKYVSTTVTKVMHFIVEDVTVGDDEDENFFLVSIIDEASNNDMSAMGDELDPNQWFALVERYGLVRIDV